MPPFLATILAGVVSSVAAESVNARIRAAWAPARGIGEARSSERAAPQTVDPRAVLTPRVTYGPPVNVTRPPTAAGIASRLAARAR